ncbi:MAG: hypothetical protein CVV27_11510 [Candidatus Melainabacteria bacterium HGW-Melainabacteria-1]|nr:MAG: hypothetical protein CVV27_11510 [Candidatus Melainabacteria bacterium HGW-Melainabacteria-1]
MSGTRNHQVGVLRDGDRAYVLSNNEVQSFDVNGRSDADLIQAAHPDFDDIVADQSGAMKVGTESLSVGDFLPGNQDVTVTQIVDGSTATGRRTLPDGTSVNVQINFNVDTGEFRSRINPQAGDVLVDGSGNQITMTSGSHGTVTMADGRTGPVEVSVAADGSWSWRG